MAPSLNFTLSTWRLLTVCLPLISSIKLHKSNHLCSVAYIFPYCFPLCERLDVFSQACLIHVFVELTTFVSEKVSHMGGNSFWLLLLWAVTALQLCFAPSVHSGGFVPLQRSHRLNSQPSKRITFPPWGRVCLFWKEPLRVILHVCSGRCDCWFLVNAR